MLDVKPIDKNSRPATATAVGAELPSVSSVATTPSTTKPIALSSVSTPIIASAPLALTPGGVGKTTTPQITQPPAVTLTVDGDNGCHSGGTHAPSVNRVNDFVRQVRGRMRYISVCSTSPDDIATEVASMLAKLVINATGSPITTGTVGSGRLAAIRGGGGGLPRRSISCPDVRQLEEAVTTKQLQLAAAAAAVSQAATPASVTSSIASYNSRQGAGARDAAGVVAAR